MKEEAEVWDDVIGFDGYYSVSTLGRVKSDRTNKIMGTAAKRGNRQVTFCVGGIRSKHYVSRLVALTFIGDIPEGHIVIHKNKIKTDDRLLNLKIGTCSESLKIDYQRNVRFDWGISGIPIERSSQFFNENGVADNEGNIETLKCICCETEKPIADFYKKKNSVRHKCKTCILEQMGVVEIGKSESRKNLALNGLRICSICKKEKPLEDGFCKNRKSSMGRSHNCKECSKVLNAIYSEKRKAKQK